MWYSFQQVIHVSMSHFTCLICKGDDQWEQWWKYKQYSRVWMVFRPSVGFPMDQSDMIIYDRVLTTHMLMTSCWKFAINKLQAFVEVQFLGGQKSLQWISAPEQNLWGATWIEWVPFGNRKTRKNSSVVVYFRKPLMDFLLKLTSSPKIPSTNLDDGYSNGTEKYRANKPTCQTL